MDEKMEVTFEKTGDIRTIAELDSIYRTFNTLKYFTAEEADAYMKWKIEREIACSIAEKEAELTKKKREEINVAVEAAIEPYLQEQHLMIQSITDGIQTIKLGEVV